MTLIWLDDGTTTDGYTKVNEFEVIVDHTSAFVTLDVAHIEALADAISNCTSLRELSIANCSFGPIGVSTLATRVTWPTAGVVEVDDPSLLDSIKHKVKLNDVEEPMAISPPTAKLHPINMDLGQEYE